MAQIPYTAEIRSKKIATDVATRLYQFMQINKLIDGLSILNGSKQNTEDLLNLSAKIERLYTGYLNDKLEKPEDIVEADRIFKDEKLMDIADKIAFSDSDEEKLAQMQAYTAQKMAQTVMNGTPYTEIDSGYADSADLSLTGTLFIVLEKENRKIDSEDFANRIINSNLEPDEIPLAVNTLQAAKQKVIERLKTDWQTYEGTRTQNPNIEPFRDYFEANLTESKDFHYKTYPETHNVLLCIRDDFADKDNGSKPAFLKMMGSMLDCGYRQMSALLPNSSKIYNDKNYANFIDLIKKQYPDNSEQVINTMLGVTSDNNLEQERRAAFDKKSKEFFGKFLSAVLVKKQEQNNADHIHGFNYANYIKTCVAAYIAELKEGKNNVAPNLHLADESKAKSLKQLIDDTAETQIISVHHKIPVASAVPLYVMQHQDMHDETKLQKMFKELAQKCPKAVKNRTPNDIAIIGLALSAFPEEAKKDNLAEIYKITDEKKRQKALQVLANKREIYDIYKKYFPVPNILEIKQEILKIVNDPSNHTLPLGSNVHQKMEPNGNGSISKKDDKLIINVENTSRLNLTTNDKISNATVFAAEYDLADLSEVIKSMNPGQTMDKKFIDGLKEANPLLKKADNSSNHQTITARMNLDMPETGFMRWMRTLLNTTQRTAPIQYMKSAIGLSK